MFWGYFGGGKVGDLYRAKKVISLQSLKTIVSNLGYF